MKVYIETYGCAANKSDSEIMSGILIRDGHKIVNSTADADAIIINTCIVKHTTEEKIKFRIKKLKEEFPNKRIIIAGCMVTGEPELAKSFNLPTIGPSSISDISKIVSGELFTSTSSFAEKPILPYAGKKPVRIVEISQGCLGNCSYCITKFARGRQISYKPESILKAVKNAVVSGYKEIWITSQDNSSYGIDIGTNLAELLKKISDIDGDFKVRVGMMNPAFLNDIGNLIEVFKSDKIFKFAHIPVQSGSDRILKLMKRGYTVDDFIGISKDFQKIGATLWTDVIVGFPTESEDDFSDTLEMLKKVRPDFTNISRYSNRPGTKAKKMKQVPTEIKKERSRVASKLVNKISYEKNMEWVGWKGEIIIDEFSHKNYIGRNFAYKPVSVDGEYELGSKVNVKIVKAYTTHLEGAL